MTQTTNNISRTEVADILEGVLPTYVVKYIASYIAHPLAGLSREMGEQYFNLSIMLPGKVSNKSPRWSRHKILYFRGIALAPADGEFVKRHRLHVANQVYLDHRKRTIYCMNMRLSARHQIQLMYPLKHRFNTKKEILDFATKHSIKLSMSWTKTKMLMVFNSKYGA